jgi:hypothetical protein
VAQLGHGQVHVRTSVAVAELDIAWQGLCRASLCRGLAATCSAMAKLCKAPQRQCGTEHCLAVQGRRTAQQRNARQRRGKAMHRAAWRSNAQQRQRNVRMATPGPSGAWRSSGDARHGSARQRRDGPWPIYAAQWRREARQCSAEQRRDGPWPRTAKA